MCRVSSVASRFNGLSIDLSVAAPVMSMRSSRGRVIVEAAKKSVGDLNKADLEGKRVFVRADLNVPLDKQLAITDDTRIRAAVPTLKYLMDNGAKVLLTSHLVSCIRGHASKRLTINHCQKALADQSLQPALPPCQ